ncbi:hypothetical protein MRX96_058251 [Rhipicephalus microplus]
MSSRRSRAIRLRGSAVEVLALSSSRPGRHFTARSNRPVVWLPSAGRLCHNSVMCHVVEPAGSGAQVQHFRRPASDRVSLRRPVSPGVTGGCPPERHCCCCRVGGGSVHPSAAESTCCEKIFFPSSHPGRKPSGANHMPPTSSVACVGEATHTCVF